MEKSRYIHTIRFILSIALFVFICFGTLGCVDRRSDVSDDKFLWGGYNTESIYKLQIDVFLIRVSSGAEPKRLALVPEKSIILGVYERPESIEEYRNNPEEAVKTEYGASMDVKGIVESGTLVKPEILKLHAGWNFMTGKHDYLYLYARILSGPFKDTLVDINDISEQKHNEGVDLFLHYPHPKVLAEVQVKPTDE